MSRDTHPTHFAHLFKCRLSGTITCFILSIGILTSAQAKKSPSTRAFSPVCNAKNVNPDTHLTITFPSTPTIGNKGQIRVYDASTNKLVDLLDMSIAAGPTAGATGPKAPYSPIPYKYVDGRFTNGNTKPGTPSGVAVANSDQYQLTIIGGFTDAFHFYPIIVRGNTATIYLHNNLLEYGKTYYAEVDAEVIQCDNAKFVGISKNDNWRFTTKTTAPALSKGKFIVDQSGKGDFNTVQGAIDHIPAYHPNPVTIFIKNGVYEEIVYFRNKTNITIKGEDRNKVVVCYANNEVFNPHPENVSTNEVEGTFPSRRAAFMVDHSSDIYLQNMTIKTTAKGQAEGLLVNGERIVVDNVTIEGSGDALQTNGTVYYRNCKIVGDGDTVLGRGTAFFDRCELYSYGAFMWIRNTDANHGNVFVSCTFKTLGEQTTEIARAPINKGKSYPYCEAVLINCKLSGISPIGWGPVEGETGNVRFWEYNSTDLATGHPIDASQRHPATRQLSMTNDSLTIANYLNPTYVLGGWTPILMGCGKGKK